MGEEHVQERTQNGNKQTKMHQDRMNNRYMFKGKHEIKEQSLFSLFSSPLYSLLDTECSINIPIGNLLDF